MNSSVFLNYLNLKADKNHTHPEYEGGGGGGSVTNVVTKTEYEADKIVTNQLIAKKANIEDLKATNAEITNLKAENATINNLVASKADIIELNAQVARIENLYATKAEITELEAVRADINVLNADSATINNLLAGNLTAGNIQAGSITSNELATGTITAGSGVIADGAIGNAQISKLSADKLEAGTIDTSKVVIQGSNGHMRMRDNRFQVFEGVGSDAFERVSLGDVNGDGTAYGFRVRGKDGTTILYDENGVREEGITDGAITNEKISNSAEIDGAKLNIASVINKINEDGTGTIEGFKISIDGTSLDTKLERVEQDITEHTTSIKNNTSKIEANEEAIKLKVSEQIYQEDKTELTSQLDRNTSSIEALRGEIALKVEQTHIENAKSEMEGIMDSKVQAAKGEIKVTTDSITQSVTNLTETTNTKADKTTVSNLQSKVGTLETSVNGIKGTVSNLETTTNTLEDDLSSTKTQLTQTKSELATLDVNLKNITQRVSNTENTVSNVSTVADSKAKIFTSQPIPPYKLGDIWVQGVDGEIMKCRTARTSGNFLASDWDKASKYTDDTKVNTLRNEYNHTKSQVAEIVTDLDGITQRVSSTETTLQTTTNKVDNLAVGGRNLQRYGNPYLLNGEPVSDKWKVGRGTLSLKGDEAFPDYPKKVYWLTQSANESFNSCWANLKEAYYSIYVEEGKAYSFSMDYVRGMNCKGVNIRLFKCDNDANITTIYSSGTEIPDNKLQHLEATWISTYTGDIYVCIYNAGEINTGGVESNLLFTNVKFEKGNKCTDWTPATEDVQTQIDTNTSQLSTTNSKVAEITTSLNAITQRVSSTESTTSTLTTKVNTAQSTADSAKTTANTANTQATTNKNNISTLTTTVSNTNSKVSSLETNLSGITSRVSATETNLTATTNKVNNLTVGGRNLQRYGSPYLLNGESPSNKWNTGRGTLHLKADGAFPDHPKKVYWLTQITNETTNSCWANLKTAYNKIRVENGKEYTISLDYVRGYNCKGIKIQLLRCDNDGLVATAYSAGTEVKDNILQRITKTWTSTFTGEIYVCIYNQGEVTLKQESNLLFTNVKFEKGNKATDWTPAVEDVQEQIDTTQTTVSNLTTRVSSAEQKLTKDSLTTTIGSHYTTSSDVNGIVSSKGYATTSQVQQTATSLTATFKESGGYNLIRNGGFILGKNSWIDYGGGMSIGGSRNVACGYYVDTVLPNGFYGDSFIPLENGKTYTYSARVFPNSNISMLDTYPLYPNINSNKGSTLDASKFVVLSRSHDTILSGRWTTISITFKINSGANVHFQPWIYHGGSTATISVADIQLEEGSIVTPWSPHAQEIKDGIITLDKNGVKVSHQNSSFSRMDSKEFYQANESGNRTLSIRYGGTRYYKWANNLAYVGGTAVTRIGSNDEYGITTFGTGHSHFLDLGFASDLYSDGTATITPWIRLKHWENGIHIGKPFINRIQFQAGTQVLRPDKGSTWGGITFMPNGTYKYCVAGDQILSLGNITAYNESGNSYSSDSVFTISRNDNIRLSSFAHWNFNWWTMYNMNTATVLNAQSEYLRSRYKDINEVYGTRTTDNREIRCKGKNEFTCIGETIVEIPQIIAENIQDDYQVYISKYGFGDYYIKERNSYYFVIEADREFAFDWEVVATQIEKPQAYTVIANTPYQQEVYEANANTEEDIQLHSKYALMNDDEIEVEHLKENDELYKLYSKKVNN